MERLLTVRDIMDLLRISYPTIYRLRKAGMFPPPVGQCGKLLWHPADIERWSNYRQSQSDVAGTSEAVVGAAQQKREAKTFKQRQESARAALQRHGINRSNKED